MAKKIPFNFGPAVDWNNGVGLIFQDQCFDPDGASSSIPAEGPCVAAGSMWGKTSAGGIYDVDAQSLGLLEQVFWVFRNPSIVPWSGLQWTPAPLDYQPPVFVMKELMTLIAQFVRTAATVSVLQHRKPHGPIGIRNGSP